MGGTISSATAPPLLFLFWLQMSPAPDSRNQGGRGFLVEEAAAQGQAAAASASSETRNQQGPMEEEADPQLS